MKENFDRLHQPYKHTLRVKLKGRKQKRGFRGKFVLAKLHFELRKESGIGQARHAYEGEGVNQTLKALSGNRREQNKSGPTTENEGLITTTLTRREDLAIANYLRR